MSNLPARDILDSITTYDQSGYQTPQSSDRPIRLATVNPLYTAGLPQVIMDGETQLSQKGYTWSSTYTPKGGDRVYLMPVGQSYVIGGKIASAITIPQFHSLAIKGGWSPYTFDAAYYPPEVTRTASGVVLVQGLIAGGPVAAGTVVATLPEPFRPLVRHSFSVMANGAPAGVDIKPNGDIVLGTGVSNSSYLSLDNIIFNNNPALEWTDHTLLNSFQPLAPNPQDGDMAPQYTLDPLGRVWNRGGVFRTVRPTVLTNVAILPVGLRPDKQILFPTYGQTPASAVDITNLGEIRWRANSGLSAWWYLDQPMFVISSKSDFQLIQPLWNGWINNSATHSDASFWKDADGIVHLRGLVRGGSSGVTLGTLPQGYRPRKRLLRATINSETVIRVDITPEGQIIPTTGATSWVSLEGITFIAEGW